MLENPPPKTNIYQLLNQFDSMLILKKCPGNELIAISRVKIIVRNKVIDKESLL